MNNPNNLARVAEALIQKGTFEDIPSFCEAMKISGMDYQKLITGQKGLRRSLAVRLVKRYQVSILYLQEGMGRIILEHNHLSARIV